MGTKELGDMRMFIGLWIGVKYIRQYDYVVKRGGWVWVDGVRAVYKRCQLAKFDSGHVYVHPHLHMTTADWALLHLGRAIAARALVAAWHSDVRLGVSEADDAR